MVILALFAMLVSNMGLANLIRVSLPVLTAIYPPCIALVLLSFSQNRWRSARRVFAPVIATSLVFGLADGLKASSFSGLLPAWFDKLPLANRGWSGCSLRCWCCCWRRLTTGCAASKAPMPRRKRDFRP